jgi:uncharacterized protein YjbJ (UPF0337 family)
MTRRAEAVTNEPTGKRSSNIMGAKMDDAKGRAKEAGGVLSGDKDLENEGKLDQAGGAVKDKVDKGKDALSDAVDSVKDKLNDRQSS